MTDELDASCHIPDMSFIAGHSRDIGTKNRDVFDSNLEILPPEKSQPSMASWFAALQKPFKSRTYTNGGTQSVQIDDTRTNAKRNINVPASLTSNDLDRNTQDLRHHSSFPNNGILHPSNSGTTEWLGVSSEGNRNPSNPLENTSKDQMELSDFNISTQGADASDGTSNSRRMGSTPSKASAMSSNTSFGPAIIKTEVDDGHVLFSNRDSPAPSSLSSQLSPAKSITPAALKPTPKTTSPKSNPRAAKQRSPQVLDFRPRTSIPTNLAPADLAHQSIHAAYSSRLNPYALHPSEYHLLRDHICHHHVTAYLNIRNRILRLWVRNPLVSVTAEEAAGCALSSRWLGLAQVAYEWLLRRGYINFGCVEIPDNSTLRTKRYQKKRSKRKSIVVVGAGMAGLGCARQLEGLFRHYEDYWAAAGEEVPTVSILEGRSRIGGRVYSHPLRTQMPNRMPENARHAAEMGAHIITGFDHGNPLNIIIRGQLALHYYPLKDNSRLYDIDGRIVDKERDTMVEKLFNDILDRASVYRHRAPLPVTAEGDKELIDGGRDPQGVSDQLLKDTDAQRSANATTAQESEVESVPGGVDKLTGKAHMVTGPRAKVPPALAARAMGWQLPSNVLASQDLNLDSVAKSSQHPTLGAAMDEAVKQYQFILDLSPQDMRLLNWHFANLEYANAVNVGKLSLGGWDQDIGNEFEGEHTQVIGGYQQVPRAIWHYPTKLDVRTQCAISGVNYSTNEDGMRRPAEVHCENGETYEADHVILTTPLGVLKEGSIRFEPTLPSWKLDPIQRLGFGKLNKVILVYDKPFWNIDQDMFGLLREADVPDSLDQEDYVANRGRFYLFWNCIKTTGLPLLIALMAGDAAHQAEGISDAELVAGVTQDLARMFRQTPIPVPIETVVTRWGNDRFARGTYSYVGATSQPGDYEAMAQPIGNLHFAGEATCGTHPATVHGAYISGLRAAAEVLDEMLGPIEIPKPLVPDHGQTDIRPGEPSPKRKAEEPPRVETAAAKHARLEAFESEILQAIFAQLGLRPSKPGKASANPFLLFTKENWTICKQQCDEARRAATGSTNNKSSRDEVRVALGKMWREAPEKVKRPYVIRTNEMRAANLESAATFTARLAAWDERAMEVRRKYVDQHPGILSDEEEIQMWAALGVYESVDQRPKKVSGYAEDSGSEEVIDT